MIGEIHDLRERYLDERGLTTRGDLYTLASGQIHVRKRSAPIDNVIEHLSVDLPLEVGVRAARGRGTGRGFYLHHPAGLSDPHSPRFDLKTRQRGAANNAKLFDGHCGILRYMDVCAVAESQSRFGAVSGPRLAAGIQKISYFCCRKSPGCGCARFNLVGDAVDERAARALGR